MEVSTFAPALGPDDKRRALDEVLHSAAFARADQLKRFLRYICEMEIAGRAAEIHEYSIGTEALGRKPGYSTGDDSSVRSRAYALRQKLQEFYETERPDSPVLIEIPKGSYTPHFTNRTPAVALPETAKPYPYTKPLWAFFGGVAITTLFAVAFLALTPFRPPRIPTVLSEAWGPMASPGAEAIVCLAAPPALLLKTFKEGTVPSVPRLLPAPKEVADWYAGLHELDGGGDLYMQTTLNSALVGDALASAAAVRFLTASGAVVQVLPEPGLSHLALRGRNVLLIGSPNYSQYAARVLRDSPFSVRYDPVRKEEVIADGPPEAGARRIFRPKRDQFNQMRVAYGLITVLPSQAGDDSRTRTVIFSGVTSAGPQAAMEFFSSAASMLDLKQRMGTRLPAAYQVVVRCSLDRTLALNWTYEAHETMKRPPLLD